MSDEPKDPREDAYRSLFASHEEPREPAPEGGASNARTAPARRPFNFYGGDDLKAASDLADEFDRLAGLHPNDDDLGNVMRRFHEAARTHPARAQWGLRLFIGRRPGEDVLPMPTLRAQLNAQREHDEETREKPPPR
jgi:hypothetical protein